jgi:deoxyribonuclease-4
MDRLRFGTAGIPLTMPDRNSVDAPAFLKKIGLESMELEFVHSVNIGADKARLVKKSAEENDIKLTCHAPYFINLCSAETAKVSASKQRILHSAEIAALAGAGSLTFHAGFYQGAPLDKVYDKIKSEIKDLSASLKKKGINIMLRPETTGKESQFGCIEELVRMAKEVSGVGLCVDFAHLFARSAGKFNGEQDFGSVLKLIKDELGNRELHDMHIHISGMNYGPKGEKNHLVLQDHNNKFDYRGLIAAFHKYAPKGIVVSESPNIEEDALLMKKLFYK